MKSAVAAAPGWRSLAYPFIALAMAIALSVRPVLPAPEDANPVRQVEDGTLLVLNVDDDTIAQGTAFAIDAEGTVVTNYHVARSGGAVYVAPPDGAMIPCTRVAVAPELDLAILKASAPVPFLRAGDARQVRAGERVATTGYPRRLSRGLDDGVGRPVTTHGVVQGVRERGVEIEGRPLVLLRTTARVEPGNSGGPLFRPDTGEVIGVMAAGLAINKRLTGVTFAIPINEVYGLQRRQPTTAGR